MLVAPLSTNLSAVLANWGGPSWLDVNKCDAYLHEGSEEGFR